MDLIFAEATPPGRGGVSVIRLSGDGARRTASALVGPMDEPRKAYFRTLSEDGEPIDQVLAMWFPQGGSFTGEEVAELHLHGAPVVARRVSAALLRAGARAAEAGEFTRRAFLNGKLDAAEIEGLGDLLIAETEAQRKLAIRAASGELARKAERWRSILIEAGALVEVSVDFADEDVPDEVPEKAFSLLNDLVALLQFELNGFDAAERVRTGFVVAIVGAPNAGKSSLINYLARRDLSIVSEIAGTTRDVIELRFDLKGLAVTLLDTAGLRGSNDEIESLGIQRAIDRANAADMRIHLSRDGSCIDDLWRDGDMAVRSHADVKGTREGFAVSSVTGEGMDELTAQVFQELSTRVADAGLVSHERQRQEIVDAVRSLTGVDGRPAEFVAEGIRQANRALDRLLGRIDADDYLDHIFLSFCIGK